MEEAAETLLRDIGLPDNHAVNRVSLLPRGFVEELKGDEVQGSPFWHIYLDNYASGQRLRQGERGWIGAEAERLEKTMKLSLWLCCRNNLRHKSLQIVCTSSNFGDQGWHTSAEFGSS